MQVTISEWADRVRTAAWAVVVAIVTWPRVVGFTTDSDAYIDVASNVLGGRGLVQTVVDFWRPSIPDPLGMWPPLYPLVVALPGAAGVPLPLAARLVAAGAFVAFALGFRSLARRSGGRGFAFVVTIGAMTLSVLAVAGVTAWSESLYLALLTAAASMLAGLLESGGSARRWFACGLVFGLAASTRSIGLAAVPVALGVALLERAPRQAIAALALGIAFPVVPWLAHNVAIFGRVLGPELPGSSRTLAQTLGALAAAARWELLPPLLAASAATAIASLGLVALALAWALRAGGVARLAALLALAQVAAIAWAVLNTAINDPRGRYAIVAWPFVVLVVGLALVRAVTRFAPAAHRSTALTAVAVVSLLLAGEGFGRYLATSSKAPPEAPTRQSEMAALARLADGTSGPILSDAGHLLRTATGRAAIQVPPPAFRPRAFDAEDERRWAPAGMRWAIVRSNERATLGSYLAGRVDVPVDTTSIDSAAGFVRFRLSGN